MGDKICGVFPGQGGWRVRKRGDLCENSERAREMYNIAKEVSGIDVRKISFYGTPEEQSDPVNSQLMPFVYSRVLYELVKDKFKFGSFAGYSLGEVTALSVAGVFGKGDEGFRNGLEVVVKRGEIMKRYTPFDRSCLVSVSGCEREKVERFCEGTKGKLVIALYCSPTTHVIGGHPDSISEYEGRFPGKSIILEVNGIYHTGHYKEAAREFKDYLGGVDIWEPDVPVIANCDGKPYSVETIINKMGDQLCNPVLWDRVVREVDAGTYVEMGQGRFLTKMVREILDSPNCVSIGGLRDIAKIG